MSARLSNERVPLEWARARRMSGVHVAAVTARGQAHQRNEDAFVAHAGLGLFVVCDGLGGHAAGDVASRLAADVAAGHVVENAALLADAAVAEGGRFAVRVLVDEAFQRASRALVERSRADLACAGMGTTMTLALLWNGALVLGHVGDSRLYVLRGGELQRLTSDHTLAGELERRGDLGRDAARSSHLANVLTRSVGAEESVLVETLFLDVLPGDAFLACTDGLHRVASDDEIAAALASEELEHVPERLARLARERGGRDDVTVVVFRAAAGAAASPERVLLRLDAIAAAPAFAGLSLERRVRVLDATVPRAFAAGEELVAAGAPLAGALVLVSGAVRGVGDADYDAPGSTFGARALVREHAAPHALVATEPGELLVLARDAFDALVRRHPRLGNRMLANLVALG